MTITIFVQKVYFDKNYFEWLISEKLNEKGNIFGVSLSQNLIFILNVFWYFTGSQPSQMWYKL